MSDDKPWEDESLKGAYKEKKAEFASRVMKPYTKGTPKLSDGSNAFAQAQKLEKRQRALEKGTRPLRKLASGTEY